MDSFSFTICLISLLVLVFILIRDSDDKIILEILGIVKETLKYIYELLEKKTLEIAFTDESNLKLF